MQAGCALVGGETAEHARLDTRKMSMTWQASAVGVVDKAKILDNSTMQPGDVHYCAALHRCAFQRFLAGAQDFRH